MVQSKPSKMLGYINYRVRLILSDKRSLVGQFLAFDKHMNVVLGETEEFRSRKAKGYQGKEVKEGNKGIETTIEDRRILGLVLIRGETIVSLTIEGPPPPR